MFIHFFCLCPLGLATKLTFNISKEAYSNGSSRTDTDDTFYATCIISRRPSLLYDGARAWRCGIDTLQLRVLHPSHGAPASLFVSAKPAPGDEADTRQQKRRVAITFAFQVGQCFNCSDVYFFRSLIRCPKFSIAFTEMSA